MVVVVIVVVVVVEAMVDGAKLARHVRMPRGTAEWVLIIPSSIINKTARPHF